MSAISQGSPRTGWIIGTRSSDLWDKEARPVRVVAETRSAGSLPLRAWNHKVVVYNGSSVTEYFNGAVVSSYAASGEPLGTGRGMIIGSWQPFGQNYAGTIDDFRIYDRALTEDEVALLYGKGSLTGY